MNTDDLGALFETFVSSAFRLETLSEYRVPQDTEWLRMFREGRPRPQARNDRPWLATVRNAKARGAQMQRVRLVQTPLTEYQRFQFSWGYVENEEAGEEIRILDHEPPGLLHQDFWLFDDATAVILEYDNAGQFLRPAMVSDVASYRRARDLALAVSVPFSEYRRRVAVG
jgi:hypothetical protein